MYRADGLNLDLIDLARLRGSVVTVHGSLLFNKCEDMSSLQPVTFMTEESFIEVPVWQANTPGGSTLQFQFRTLEPDALILYSVGPSGTTHFFALEVYEGV